MIPHDCVLAVTVVGLSLSRSQIREVHDEHLFLPKALAVPDTLTASSLVGSKKTADTTRTD